MKLTWASEPGGLTPGQELLTFHNVTVLGVSLGLGTPPRWWWLLLFLPVVAHCDQLAFVEFCAFPPPKSQWDSSWSWKRHCLLYQRVLGSLGQPPTPPTLIPHPPVRLAGQQPGLSITAASPKFCLSSAAGHTAGAPTGTGFGG